MVLENAGPERVKGCKGERVEQKIESEQEERKDGKIE